MTPRHSTSISMGSRSVDPSHLEGLGKQAARLAETSGLALSEAVVQTIGHEKLNAEQVRRVVENTNVEAFHRKYSSLDPMSRVVHVDGGPADVAQVMQSLRTAAQPQEQILDTFDYVVPPQKTAAADYSMPPRSEAAAESFVSLDRTTAGIVGDVLRLQSKLAAAHESVVQDAEAAEFVMNEALVRLADNVKYAGRQGAAASEIFEAWHEVDPELAKVAFARLGRFASGNVKVASRRLNPEHEVVQGFSVFVKHAQDYASRVSARQDLEAEILRVSEWLQRHGG